MYVCTSGNFIWNSCVIFNVIYQFYCVILLSLFRSWGVLRGGWLGIWTIDTEEQNQESTKTEWAKITYVGRQTKFITKLFKNKVSFKTDSNTGKLLTQKKNINKNKLNKCGVHQLTCHDCNKKYIGQTGRSFSVRSQEHPRDFKHGNGKS